MKLQKTEVTYKMTDPSGYNFTVVCHYDQEYGWNAQVVMRTNGFKSPMDAIRHLKLSAEAFIRESKEIE